MKRIHSILAGLTSLIVFAAASPDYCRNVESQAHSTRGRAARASAPSPDYSRDVELQASSTRGRAARAPAPPPRISRSEKLLKAQTLLKWSRPPRGLTDYMELTPQTPYIHHKGSIALTLFRDVNLEENNAYGTTLNSAEIHLHISVAQAGKPHLITWHVQSDSGSSNIAFEVTGLGAEPERPHLRPRDTAIFCVLLPDRVGGYTIGFRPITGAFYFYRVEVNVVD